MKEDLRVRQEEASGDWLILDKHGNTVNGPFIRRQDARAHARALLLERGKGSLVVEAPSGRIQERLNVHKTRAGGKFVQAA